jgi:hypothetical protein
LRRTCFVELLIACLFSYRDDKESPKDGTAAPSISPAIVDEPAEPDVAPRVTRASVKKIPQTRSLKRSKKAKEVDVSLEAHASMVSPDDVSSFPLVVFFLYTCALTRLFSQALLKRFVALGTECAGYLKVAKASEGTFNIQSLFFLCYVS